jgi:hypothetical protein
LLRPGRFDRQITVNLPDVKGREEILRVHSKKVKLAEGVDLAVVARGTPGYSGAELANVINEAALLAARRGLKGITLAELEEARDKVRWGKERRSLALSEKENRPCGCRKKTNTPTAKTSCLPVWPSAWVAALRRKSSLATSQMGRVATSKWLRQLRAGWFANGA